jgi:hypothetical protein
MGHVILNRNSKKPQQRRRQISAGIFVIDCTFRKSERVLSANIKQIDRGYERIDERLER